MKKKLFGVMCGIASMAVATSLVVTALSFKKNTLFNNLFNANQGPLNTFVIDDETEFVEETGYYSGVAISSNANTINTKFVGFTCAEGKLSTKIEQKAYITNIDPINRGFNSFHAELSSSSQSPFSLMLYFSYHPLTLDDIADGKYADLVVTGNVGDHGTYIDETVTSTELPEMENCRYVLALLNANASFTLQEITFGTPCLATVPEVSEVGTYSDWKASEKTAMLDSTNYGEVIPFIGNGSYYFESGIIYGALLDGQLGSDYMTALSTAGYDMTYQAATGDGYMFLYQKKTSGDVTLSIMWMVYLTEIMAYEMELTNIIDYFEKSTEWPADKVSEALSPTFAAFVNANKFEYTDITYTTTSYSYDGIMQFSILLENFDISDLEAVRLLVDFLDDILANNANYYFYSGDELPAPGGTLPNYYSYAIKSTYTVISIEYQNGLGITLVYIEYILEDEFPTAAINAYLGLPSGQSIIPYTGSGRFMFSSGFVRVFDASLSDLQTYRNSLLANGFTINMDYGDSCQLVQGIFGAYTIYLSSDDFDTDGTFSIHYSSGSPTGSEAQSFEDALREYNYTNSELIANHSYPTLSGSHIYKYISYCDTNGFKMGIYISGLDQGYIDTLLDGAVYDNYFGLYIFENEHDGSEYFAIDAEIISGGVRIEPRTVYKTESTTLLDSVEANASLSANYENHCSKYKDFEPDLYATYMGALVELPNTNGEKVYLINDVTVKVYGNNRTTYSASIRQSAVAKGFTYSNLQSKYHLSGVDLKINYHPNNVGSYRGTYDVFEYNTDSSSYLDFASYSASNLGTIEAQFAEFPHTGSEEMFVHLVDSLGDAVIVSSEFDNEQFSDNLVANGFTMLGDEWNKIVGTSKYRVSLMDNYYDGNSQSMIYPENGIQIYLFEITEDYFDSYSNVVTSDVLTEIGANLAGALPSVASTDKLYHLYYSSNNNLMLSMKYDGATNPYLDALLAKGFVETETDRYEYAQDNYIVSCIVSIEGPEAYFDFSVRTFNWTAVPTTTDDIGSFFFYAHNYIPMPEDSGNVYSSGMYVSQSEFSFYLKKTVNISAYVEKLVDFGYELETDQSDYKTLSFEKYGQSIVCNINIHANYIEVSFMNNGKDSPKSISTANIDHYFIVKGLTGANFFTSTFNFDFERIYVHVYEKNGEAEFGFKDDEQKTYFVNQLQSSSEYTQIDEANYEKVTSSYRYSIYVSTWDNFVRLTISTIE